MSAPRRGRAGRYAGAPRRLEEARRPRGHGARRGMGPRHRAADGPPEPRDPGRRSFARSRSIRRRPSAPRARRTTPSNAGAPRARRSPPTLRSWTRCTGDLGPPRGARRPHSARRMRRHLRSPPERRHRPGPDALSRRTFTPWSASRSTPATRAGSDVIATCGKVGGFNRYPPAFGPLERPPARRGRRGPQAERVRRARVWDASRSCATPTRTTCSSAWRRSSASGCATS